MILDSGLFIEDLEFWIPGSDLRILDPEFSIPDSGRVLDPGFWNLDSGFWVPGSGFGIMDSAMRIQDFTFGGPGYEFRIPGPTLEILDSRFWRSSRFGFRFPYFGFRILDDNSTILQCSLNDDLFTNPQTNDQILRFCW